MIFKFVKDETKKLELKHQRQGLVVKDQEKLDDKGIFTIDTQRRGEIITSSS